MSRIYIGQRRDPTVGKALIASCKARYAVLFQIRKFPPEPEDEAHIGPTATYDEVIYPGFQHDITALQITRIQHLIQSAYKFLNTIQQRKIQV